MSRDDEDRARRLYEARDADAGWAARWSAENPLARFTQEQRLMRMRACLMREPTAISLRSGRVLEVGVGSGGLLPWLRDVLGVAEDRLAGIDLSAHRIELARYAMPGSDLRAGSAADLPWPDASFQMVVASTLFSSVLDPALRARIAAECMRVLAPGGAILWYDMRDDFLLADLFRRLAQPEEDWLGRGELERLFPGCRLELEPATLFMPMANVPLKISPALARAAEAALPFFRSHWIGLIVKGKERS